jgi:hypothetical protein
MVARGERPGYRVRLVDGRWLIDALPWRPVRRRAGGRH